LLVAEAEAVAVAVAAVAEEVVVGEAVKMTKQTIH